MLFRSRSSINKTTVFLKRDSKSLMINPFNNDIYIRHRANMDIQYITDPYGCAAYINAYMLKSNAVMSKLLKKTMKEIQYGNLTMREKLVRIANKFNNCSEISAQECVYTLLSMPVSRSSRDTIFVNTYPINERSHLLHDEEYLSRLDDDSKRIFKRGLLDYYVNRSKSMENVCLAEFACYYDYMTNARVYKKNLKDNNKYDDDLDEDNYDDIMDNNKLYKLKKKKHKFSTCIFLHFINSTNIHVIKT